MTASGNQGQDIRPPVLAISWSPPRAGCTHSSSTPGCLDVLGNDSLGSLEHCHFPCAHRGNITDFRHETVIGNDGNSKTVNIRFGVSIGPDDTTAVALGLIEGNGFQCHTEQLFYKKVEEAGWPRLLAGENFGHDFNDSFPLVTGSGFSVLAVQDYYVPAGSGNLYQIASYFKCANNA